MKRKTVKEAAPTKAEMFIYLDNLRESGVTNMFGAPAYVEQHFGITWDEASKVTGEWMRTFSKRHAE